MPVLPGVWRLRDCRGHMSQNVTLTLEALKANHFDARLAPTAAGGKQMMLDMIPAEATIGVGDSTTLRQMGVLDELVQRGSKVINPFASGHPRGAGEGPGKHIPLPSISRKALGTDVFLAGGNAITEDGKIVCVDRVGNRIAGIIYGSPRVILAIGRNKIVKNVDEAIDRIKNVIAPAHAACKGRKTPCAVTGKCNDCDSPDRICSITVILEKKPLRTDLSIILIDEDLGLGWDPTWDAQRIAQIKANYYRYMV